MNPILKQLNHRPLVVAVVEGRRPVVETARKAAQLGADLIELRIDLFSARDRLDIASVARAARKAANRPVLATVRSAREQGLRPRAGALKDRERIPLFQAVLPEADLIDVELASAKTLAPVLKSARKLKKMTILSHHDFRGMPSDPAIQRLVRQFKTLGGGILKVAATPKNTRDTDRLLNQCADLPDINRAFIAMGEPGSISRIAGFAFGSCLTYGFVEKSVAPGQIPLEDLVRHCRFFYPPKRTHHHN
jgi:3-dehydroquinate dehydratase-1